MMLEVCTTCSQLAVNRARVLIVRALYCVALTFARVAFETHTLNLRTRFFLDATLAFSSQKSAGTVVLSELVLFC